MPDFTNQSQVVAFAQNLALIFPHLVTYVIKREGRDNLNITSRKEKAWAPGTTIIWQSNEAN